MGLNQCFDHFGSVPRNKRWSWSARSLDGKTVAIALWRDGFNFKSKPATYTDFTPINTTHQDWMDRPGNRERLDNLIWAKDHLDGQFRVIVTYPQDPMTEPREIRKCNTVDWSMKITNLDPSTGAFSAVQVVPEQGTVSV